MRLIILAALALTACGSENRPRPIPTPPAIGVMNPAAWEVGPILSGKNYSAGVALHPSAQAGGLAIDLPLAGGHAGYVTFRHGSLTGKSRIVLRYRVEMEPGVAIVPKCCAGLPSAITVYFQRRGDDWSTDGWRWWFTSGTVSPITAGTFEIIAPLSGHWTSVEREDSEIDRASFAAAVADADRVGFTLGGGDGYGHGVYATGPARIVITGFEVN